MEHFEFTNNCEECGAQCCKNWNPARYDRNMVDNNGTCIHLDKQTNLCTIYNTRPDFCRMDLWYEKRYSNFMTLEKFLQTQRMGCEILKNISLEKNLF